MPRFGFMGAVQICVAILAVVNVRQAQAQFELGASFGYSHLTYPDESELTNDVAAIPSAQEWRQPGMRFGYLFPGGRWDLIADVGALHRSGTIGGDETVVQFLPQIQFSVPTQLGFSPFVNGGVGIEHETAPISAGSSITATRAQLGAGIGVRRSVSAGHGFLRAELRYDYLPKVEKVLDPTTTFIFLATNLLSVKLGFDLLVGH